MEVGESVFDEAFMKHMIPQLDWNGILAAANVVGFDGLPNKLDNTSLDDMDFLKAIHKLLLDIEIIAGTLECPESGRIFNIIDGIANMNISEEDA